MKPHPVYGNRYITSEEVNTSAWCYNEESGEWEILDYVIKVYAIMYRESEEGLMCNIPTLYFWIHDAIHTWASASSSRDDEALVRFIQHSLLIYSQQDFLDLIRNFQAPELREQLRVWQMRNNKPAWASPTD